MRPHYGRLFLKSPIAWFKTFFAPGQAAQFRLVDPRTRTAAVEQIWRRQRMRYVLYPFVYLLARMLWVDAVIDVVHARRLRQQQRRAAARHGSRSAGAAVGLSSQEEANAARG